MNEEVIAAMLGRIPSGLFIVSARSPDGLETGMLASWVQQASFEPPSVVVAVNRKRYFNNWLTLGAPLGFSVLGENQKKMLSHFGRGFEPGEPAFEGLSLSRTQAGLPVLNDSVGWWEGEITGVLDAGDHTIYSVRLISATKGERFDAEKPFVHIRKNGLGY